MKKILVTGSTGFVGKVLVKYLLKKGYDVRAAIHNDIDTLNSDINVEKVNYDLVSDDNDYNRLLTGIDIVIHLAAIAHQLDINHEEHKELYEKANNLAVKKLAEAAVEYGVQRFIFISTIKINGENNNYNESNKISAFMENDKPNPTDPYALSKYRAELAVRNICYESHMEYVILRPTIIFGPGIKANFLNLINLINKGFPLPLASVNNRRSLIYVDNLCHAISTCVSHPNAANSLYLIKDTDCSIVDLIKTIAHALNKSPVLLPFPLPLLKICGYLTGRKKQIDKLTESLLVDNSLIKDKIEWMPLISFTEGIEKTIQWYKANNSS